ncbi:MAG: hypothetical protein GY870_09530 [archaeon]|nr:hypothetical protein [archaeon]
MKKVYFKGCELNIEFHPEQPGIFIQPRINEHIKVVSGIRAGQTMYQTECKLLEITGQKELIKIYHIEKG